MRTGHTFFMIAASTVSELASLSGRQSSACQCVNAASCFIAGADADRLPLFVVNFLNRIQSHIFLMPISIE